MMNKDLTDAEAAHLYRLEIARKMLRECGFQPVIDAVGRETWVSPSKNRRKNNPGIPNP